MPFASAPVLRRIARRGWAALAAVLVCAPDAPAQRSASSPACASPDVEGWRCVGAVAPDNLFEPFEATLSPDGTRYVYSRVEGESRHLWLVDAATGIQRRLTHAPGIRRTPAWSPDGSLIAFDGDDIPGPLGRPAHGIGVVDPATGEERLVVHTPSFSYLRTFAWTGTGRILFRLEDLLGMSVSPGDALPRRSPATPRDGWWIADADGRNLSRITPDPGRPVFSPAGDAMAWIGRGCGDGGPHAVWTADAAGGGVRCIHPLPDHADGIGRLAWPHPDTLLYAGPVPGDTASRAHLLPVSGGPLRRLDPLDGWVTGLGVSRDGGVGLSVHRSRSRIALLPVEGGAPVPLSLPGEADGLWPEWHPSGVEIAYTGVPRRPGWGWHQLSLVRARVAHRGAEARRVGPAGRISTLTGRWSPDGRHLAAYVLEGGSPQYTIARAARPDTPAVFAGWTDGGNVAGPPDWSRDGARLLLATGSVRYGPHRDWPAWTLVWARVDSAMREREMAYVPRHEPVALDGFSGRAVRPRISPDGAWIAFGRQPGAARRGGGYVVPAAGGAVRTLAEFTTGEMLTGPEWNARGDSLHFSSPDSAGIHQLRRVGMDGGRVETLTASAENVLHPRLSPDGRTLAVTLLDVRTEMWTLPGRFPALPPAPAPVRDPGARVDPSAISPGLMEAVLAAEARPEEIRRLWPGFWDGRQVYAVRTAETDAGTEALIVSPSGLPPAGFTPVREEALPPGLRGRLYHARGLVADVRREGHGIAVVQVPAHAAAGVADRRERLRSLYAAVFDRVQIGEEPARSDAGCPTYHPQSCAVLARIERAILQRALHARGGEARELLRDYAALAWMRGSGRTPADLWIARSFGTRAYVAGRAAFAATGSPPAAYRADLGARLADTVPDDPQPPRPSETLTGEALAALLDRLDPTWRDAVTAGEPLLDALFRVARMDPVRSIARAPEVLRRHGFHAMLAALPPPESTGPRPPIGEAFYLSALRSLAPGTRGIQIDMETRRADAGELEFDYRAGPSGVAVPAPGFVFLPDPVRVRVRAGNVEMEVRGHPVALLRGPANAPEFVRVIVYPRVELTGVVESGAPGADPGQHVAGDGIDLRIGPDAHVVPGYEVYIRPAAPAVGNRE